MVQSLKERITYQRTGYVAYRRDDPSETRWLVVAVAFGFILLMFVLPEWLTTMPAVQGAFLCIILASIGYRVSMPRFYIWGGIALIAGITTAFLVRNEIVGSAITFTVTGTVMLLLGIAVFLNYLRKHPQVSTEEE